MLITTGQIFLHTFPVHKVNAKTGTYAKAEYHQADCHDHDFFYVSHTNLRLFFLEKGLPVNRAALNRIP